VDLSSLGRDHLWLDGIVLALILALAARPLVTGALLIPARLHMREKVFVMWGGLKGAVPILLAALAVLVDAEDSTQIYGLVFVVVAFSVVVQGSTIPFAAQRLKVPMRLIEPEPWGLAIRFRREPEGVQRFVVQEGSPAAGVQIADLPVGDRAWISLIVRGGQPLDARGRTTLEVGDEVVVLADATDRAELAALFEQG
jgi:cell volume regulation protein A